MTWGEQREWETMRGSRRLCLDSNLTASWILAPAASNTQPRANLWGANNSHSGFKLAEENLIALGVEPLSLSGLEVLCA